MKVPSRSPYPPSCLKEVWDFEKFSLVRRGVSASFVRATRSLSHATSTCPAAILACITCLLRSSMCL
jgi:hypothetical protein